MEGGMEGGREGGREGGKEEVGRERMDYGEEDGRMPLRDSEFLPLITYYLVAYTLNPTSKLLLERPFVV